MKSWLQRIFRSRIKSAQSGKLCRTFRPQVEDLEARVVMSTLGLLPIKPILPSPLVVTVTSTDGNGANSLSAAVGTIDADNILRSGPDEILFDVSPGEIWMSAPLTLTRGSVIINGANEAGGMVELLGETSFGALNITSSNVTVENLSFVSFTNSITLSGAGSDIVSNDVIGSMPGLGGNYDWGVVVSSSGNTISGCTFVANPSGGILLQSGASSNTISGNWIGMNSSSGTYDDQLYGVEIQPGATGNTVSGNDISGNKVDGIALDGNSNTIANNYIGTNTSGNAAVANQCGVEISGTGNTLSGNTISGNSVYGVVINGNGTTLQGNFIGTDHTGSVAVPNGTVSEVGVTDAGVLILGSNNTIGGTTAADRNIISANGGDDVYLDGNGGTGADTLATPTGNVIEGNYIGLNSGGTAILNPGGITSIGVDSEGGAYANTIGGSASGAGNTISGAVDVQIMVSDQWGLLNGSPLVGQNSIVGNFISTDYTGSNALFQGSGIELLDTVDNTIGNGNVIAIGAGQFGIEISGPSSSTSDPAGNQVLGSYIGIAMNGNNLAQSDATGVLIANSTGNTIGTLNDGNHISNCEAGIDGILNNTQAGNDFSNNGENVI